MSNEMNIIIKSKYNDFINIIDNFDTIIENKKKIENKQVEIIQNTQNQNISNKEDSSINDNENVNYKSKSDNSTSKQSIKSINTIKSKQSIASKENDISISEFNKHTVSDEKNNLTFENIEKTNDEINLSDNESKKIFKKLYSLLNTEKKIVNNENLYKNASSSNTNFNKNEENNTNDSKSNSIKLVKKKVNFENITNTKSKTKKSKKTKKENLNEEEQKEKLEQLYDKKINEENTKSSEKKSKKYKKDELKKLCKDFEEKCIMDSVRNFNVKEDMFYLDFVALTKNITSFNSSIPNTYNCSILYRNYKDNKVTSNPDKKIGWMEITKSGEKFVNSKNKYLSACHRIFDKTDKFRKTIDGTRVRALKLTFLVYKTNIKVDIFALIKSNN